MHRRDKKVGQGSGFEFSARTVDGLKEIRNTKQFLCNLLIFAARELSDKL